MVTGMRVTWVKRGEDEKGVILDFVKAIFGAKAIILCDKGYFHAVRVRKLRKLN